MSCFLFAQFSLATTLSLPPLAFYLPLLQPLTTYLFLTTFATFITYLFSTPYNLLPDHKFSKFKVWMFFYVLSEAIILYPWCKCFVPVLNKTTTDHTLDLKIILCHFGDMMLTRLFSPWAIVCNLFKIRTNGHKRRSVKTIAGTVAREAKIWI